MKFDAPEGATPLDPNEAEGLLLTHITTRAELDRWEQENIAEAEAWAFRAPIPTSLPMVLPGDCISGCLAMSGAGPECIERPARISAFLPGR